MLSGRKALKNIDRSLQTVRGEAVRLDQQLSRISGQVAMGQRRRLDLLNQIAKVRLSEIESGELETEFNSADAQVIELLGLRDIAVDKLESAIAALNVKIEQEEGQREKVLQECNAASDKLVSVESKVQAELKLSVAYVDQFSATQAAEAISEEAERKVEIASSDMAEKSKPYQNDALFMYLWDRSYGTSDYEAGLFSRFMDGWIAKLIKYEPARVNYWNLQEIPKRLVEHADRVGDVADREMMLLQQLEKDALDNAGAQVLEDNLEMLRRQLDAQDDSIEQAEVELNQMLSERAAYTSGADEYIRKSLNRISSALEHQNLDSIHRYVRQTHSPVDDKLVVELQELEDSLASLKGDMSGMRRLHDGQINRLRELESVRHQFKNSRFDDVRSGFSNEALISSVLSQFIQGVISGADLWGTIKRNQRYRNVGSSPDFGSGGLGDLADVLGDGAIDIGDILGGGGQRRRRQRRGSSWHIPKPRRSGGGFQFPRSSNRGGGFKTGGGF
ncbi:hypothetical protein NBRC116583_23480 [Arenicella sp. 4NH20-0111]|uniref:hypothetical protein n=1 Tax=Arenicella sp. 4NH20-0111 TaxID=3127648 RepID=UPI00310A5E20